MEDHLVTKDIVFEYNDVLKKWMNPDTSKPFVFGEMFREKRFYKHLKSKPRFFRDEDHYKHVYRTATNFTNTRRSGVNRALSYLATKMVQSAKCRCKKRNEGVVTITTKWVKSILVQGRCQVTGIPFQFQSHEANKDKKLRFQNPYGPSLDRIDNFNRNYEEGNVRVVLFAVNCARNNFPDSVCLHVLTAFVRSLQTVETIATQTDAVMLDTGDRSTVEDQVLPTSSQTETVWDFQTECPMDLSHSFSQLSNVDDHCG